MLVSCFDLCTIWEKGGGTKREPKRKQKKRKQESGNLKVIETPMSKTPPKKKDVFKGFSKPKSLLFQSA